MIFLQLWWTLMVLTGSTTAEGGSQAGSVQLSKFHHSVNEARDQLHELQSNYDQVQADELYRPRRNSIDDLLASFAQATDKERNDKDEDQSLQQAADDWFRDLNAGMEQRVNADAEPSAVAVKHLRAAGKSQVTNNGLASEQTEVAKVKKKYKDMSEEHLPLYVLPEKQPYETVKGGATELDIKLKHVQQQLHNQEQQQHMLQQQREEKKDFRTSKERERERESQLPQYGDNPVPDGVYEQTLARLQFSRNNANNLSHEANYKLSKIEQEAAEARSKSRYPAGLRKRSSTSGFNPMNEIKLKTSNRLMRKGMGPSLPSNALTDTMRAHYVDDLIMRRERKMQRQKEQQEQLHGNEKNAMLQPYDTLDSPDASSMSSSSSNVNLYDTPQSYDYRLPHIDQFHALSQRVLPHMRDYAHANARLKMERDRERFKRHPEQLKQSETIKEKCENAMESEKAVSKLPEAEDLMAKLAAKDSPVVKEKSSHELEMASNVKAGPELNSAQPAAPVKADTAEQSKAEIKLITDDKKQLEVNLNQHNIQNTDQRPLNSQIAAGSKACGSVDCQKSKR
ncbi:GH17800 [Drosophila grimshawi]|uniref:GH17800 n=1 Tax=Drosophila grimshawi TaxID=7222 RepID=B4K2B9_DROGR|nr:GH17800 [Drosophila grimshawi]